MSSNQNISTAARQPLMEFLSLAPTVSSSYPQTQDKTRARGDSTASAESTPTSDASSSRRSSETSGTSGQARVLKLGPVHWGEHTDDHKADFYEVPSEPKA